MSELETEVRDAGQHVSVDWSSVQVERGVVAFARRRRRSDLARATSTVAIGALVAAAIALGPQLGGERERRPEAPVAGVSRPLADGSTITGLSPETSLELARNTPDAIEVRLVRASARFDVTHRPGRSFVVAAGDVAVHVIGTSFEVERGGEETRVHVLHGRVRITWPTGQAELGAGERGRYPPPERTAAEVPEAADADAPRADARPEPEAPTRAPSRSRARRSTVEPRERQREASDEDAGELLRIADEARLARRPAGATRALERFLSRHAGDPRASSAAFMLGLVRLRDLADPEAAARAFVKAGELDPGGELAEDALAREVEAWGRAREPERARDAARRYLERYPRGRWLTFIRQQVDEP